MSRVKANNAYRGAILHTRDVKLAINVGPHKIMYIDENNTKYTFTGSVNQFLKSFAGRNFVGVNKGIAINPHYIDKSKPFQLATIYLREYEEIQVSEKIVRKVKKIFKKMKKPSWRQFFFKGGRRRKELVH